MKKYNEVLNQVNDYLEEFNDLLSQDMRIELLDLNKINDENYFLKTTNKIWNEFAFPRNCRVGGLYFYFGFSYKSNLIYLYIGKASFNSTIGKRLYYHFKNSFVNNALSRVNINDEEFLIELITNIPFEISNQKYFSSSAEEFLLSKFKENAKYNLINKIR